MAQWLEVFAAKLEFLLWDPHRGRRERTSSCQLSSDVYMYTVARSSTYTFTQGSNDQHIFFF